MEDRAKYEVAQKETTPATVLDLAIEKGASLEQLEKFMELKIKWEEREAKKAYVKAMAEFKKDPPEILKTEKVEYARKDGRITNYNHAALDRVADAINKGLSAHGLYARWEMNQPDMATVEVTCIITHELAHSEQFTMKAPPDNSDGKNSIQAISSTNTYLERITLLGITGLAAKGMDDDGNSACSVEYISEQQLSTITDFINAKSIDEAKFLAYMKVESLEMIPANKYSVALAACKAAKGNKVREPGEDDE